MKGTNMVETRTPVVFIHGLWLHASSWGPWLDLFTEAGYAPAAPGWPGIAGTVEEARANPDSIAGHGIDDVTRHYAKIIDELPVRPILIGHSFGGMIAEKLLGEDYGVAAIGIDAAQIKGVLPLPLSALRSTLPVFKNPANSRHAVSLTAEQFHYGFGNALSAGESAELYERWTIPAPGKPLFEAEAQRRPRQQHQRGAQGVQPALGAQHVDGLGEQPLGDIECAYAGRGVPQLVGGGRAAIEGLHAPV